MLLRKPEELTPENIDNSLVEERGSIIYAKEVYNFSNNRKLEYYSWNLPTVDIPEVDQDLESGLYTLNFIRVDCGGYDAENATLYFKTLSELLEAIGITKEMLKEELCA